VDGTFPLKRRKACFNDHFINGEEKQMGKMRENPRYNIVSMRISEEEREYLKKVMVRTNKSVSDIMREALRVIALRYGS
jgi:hypothetical protein